MEINRYQFECQSISDEKSFLLASDLHIEDIAFDKKRFSKDFDLALEKEARIYINGDVMSGIVRSDAKRYVPGRDRFSDRNDAIDQIIDYAYEMLLPYVDNIDLIGMGNHEISLMKYHHGCPTKRLIEMLNQKRDPKLEPIKNGGYTGWIIITMKLSTSQSTQRYLIYYTHGHGTSAPVTKGAINLNRYQYHAANLIWSGHIHQRMIINLDTLFTLDHRYNLVLMPRFGLITGCYLKLVSQYDINKDGYQMDYGEERMRTPQAIGGAFLTLNYNKKRGLITPRLELTN